jgi:hypothetical protein
VATVEESHVEVYAYEDEYGCWDNILGWATYSYPEIWIWTDCVKYFGEQSDGTTDPWLVRELAAHELGHQMGIWEHVLDGDAVMEPYNRSRHAITELDVDAFADRDRDLTILPADWSTDASTASHAGHEPGVETCVFTAE